MSSSGSEANSRSNYSSGTSSIHTNKNFPTNSDIESPDCSPPIRCKCFKKKKLKQFYDENKYIQNNYRYTCWKYCLEKQSLYKGGLFFCSFIIIIIILSLGGVVLSTFFVHDDHKEKVTCDFFDILIEVPTQCPDETYTCLDATITYSCVNGKDTYLYNRTVNFDIPMTNTIAIDWHTKSSYHDDILIWTIILCACVFLGSLTVFVMIFFDN